MTNVTIYKEPDGKFIGFDCIGHAGYAEEGSDIVCAAISILVINTINAIEVFAKDRFQVSQQEDAGIISFRFDEDCSHDANLLVQTMILGLKEIQTSFGNGYISLMFKEV